MLDGIFKTTTTTTEGIDMSGIDDCLDFDPFEGDFGDQGDKTLLDKLVKGRKSHSCFHCGKDILKGEVHRSRVDISCGEMLTFRWCGECCELMAKIAVHDSDNDESEIDDLEIKWEQRSGMFAPARSV